MRDAELGLKVIGANTEARRFSLQPLRRVVFPEPGKPQNNVSVGIMLGSDEGWISHGKADPCGLPEAIRFHSPA